MSILTHRLVTLKNFLAVFLLPSLSTFVLKFIAIRPSLVNKLSLKTTPVVFVFSKIWPLFLSKTNSLREKMLENVFCICKKSVKVSGVW